MLKPEIIVFAGPNGSGKSSVTKLSKVILPYINADDIKCSTLCTDLEAAKKAEALRNQLIENKRGFTFETVMSTDRNLNLLKKAKEKGFFIRCIYVLTIDPNINIFRVQSRKMAGGHDVPKEKILSRYYKALNLLPDLIEICDVCHIYDNSTTPFRIFKKRKSDYFYWENNFWNKKQIENLVKLKL